jgi:hypothetical protein
VGAFFSARFLAVHWDEEKAPEEWVNREQFSFYLEGGNYNKKSNRLDDYKALAEEFGSGEGGKV